MNPPRVPLYEFPDVVLHAEESIVKGHPRYPAAKGGEILASEATIKRAGPGFKVEPFSVLQVKGKEKGVATYRILPTL